MGSDNQSKTSPLPLPSSSEENESSSTINDPPHCDRRLSRAARSILVNKMLPILQHYDKTTASDQVQKRLPLSSLSDDEKVDFYERSIISLMKNPDKCLLNPKKDIHWEEERSHTTIKVAQGRGGSRKQIVHVCGICGKKFLSKYYLDSHVETRHNKRAAGGHSQDDDDEICPANQVCNRLGELSTSICQLKAIEDEPFYAPGIHKKDNLVSQSIKRKYQNEAHAKPCRDSDMKECYEMFETCFSESNSNAIDNNNDADSSLLVRDLGSLLCDTQSCQHQLHTILNPNSFSSIHEGREEWDSHHENINSIGFGLFWFIVFGIIYYWRPLYRIINRQLKKRRSKRKVFDDSKRKRF